MRTGTRTSTADAPATACPSRRSRSELENKTSVVIRRQLREQTRRQAVHVFADAGALAQRRTVVEEDAHARPMVPCYPYRFAPRGDAPPTPNYVQELGDRSKELGVEDSGRREWICRVGGRRVPCGERQRRDVHRQRPGEGKDPAEAARYPSTSLASRRWCAAIVPRSG